MSIKIFKFIIILSLVFFVVFFSHIYSLIITSWDSHFVPYVVMSIINKGDTNLDEYESKLKKEPNMGYSTQYVNGHYYSLYPIGTPLLAVPVYFIFKHIAPMLHPQRWNNFYFFQLFTASFIVALTAVFIYLIAYLSTGNAIISSLLVAVFAFCTSAWSVASRALWQHGPSMLVLSIALFLILLAKKRPFIIKFAGLPLAFSYLIRPTNTISIILLTLFVFLEYRRYFVQYLLWPLMIYVPFLIYTFNIHNSFLPNYYAPSNNFSVCRNIWVGLAGHLFSPSRGILIFSPILLFSFYGMFLKLSARKVERLDLFLVAIIFMHWMVISYYPDWTGSFSIGSRYFSDMVPYFVFFLVPVIGRITQMKGAKQIITAVVFFSLMAVSFMIHHRCATELGPARWNNKIDDNKWDMKSKVWDWRDIQFLN